ncbi:MAG: TIGR02186 family protein [Pseudomonadota bacterium]|nr:TIGR02186 family protein [Pseudomonadota bacterium]
MRRRATRFRTLLPVPAALKRCATALLSLWVLVSVVPAAAETIVTSLSSHRVAITSNYTGTSIAVFGVIERDAQSISRASPYDIVATVRGPRQTLLVREKEPAGIVWINQEQQIFPDAPAYLGVFATRPLEEITGEALQRRQRIGLAAIVNAPDFTADRGAADDAFREALLRLKQRENLYIEDERAVTFLTPSLFRVNVPLPATAPPGNYEVDVRLFADTVILSNTQTSFELVKTGFEQQVGEVARDLSALYGLATAALAMLFGWVASVIFRRD